MNTDPKRPPNLPETEFNGDLQVFTVDAVLPDDPRLEPRVRKGRPADRVVPESERVVEPPKP